LTLERTSLNKLLIDTIDYEADGSYRDLLDAASASLESARDIPDVKGLNLVLAGPLFRCLNYGLAAHIPGKTLVNQKFGPMETPYFLDFYVPARRFSLSLGLAVRARSYLSVGLGASIIATTSGEALAHMPMDDPDNEAVFTTDYSFNTTAAPTAGVLFSPNGKLDLGFSYRGKLSISMDSYQVMITNVDVGPFRLDMPFPVRLRAVTQFTPSRLAFGFAWRPTARIILTGDVTRVAWSGYRPPFPDIEIDFNEIDQIALPLEHPTIPEVPDADFKDIIVPRLGVEVGLRNRMDLRAGLFYRPSPAPVQTGPTNIIAPDILGLTCGLGVEFNPFGFLSHPAEIALHLQALSLGEKAVDKDEALFEDMDSQLDGLQNSNPGFPGIEYGGRVTSIGIGIVLPL
jgi:hypothetical protein